MEEIIFPNQIRTFRRLKGIGMQQLADFLGVSLSAVSKIEKGYRRVDQDQLIKLSQYLDCPVQEIFVNENTANPDVLQMWKKEQERRSKINEGGGLRILGAGLRYIRTKKNLTLVEVADAFGMTLSVYHRIEMGQREADQEEFERIARTLGYSSVELQKEIYQLHRSGHLKEFMPHSEAKFKAGPKGGIPGQEYRFDNYRSDKNTISIKIYGIEEEGKDNYLTINFENVLGTCFCPATYVTANTYAIALNDDTSYKSVVPAKSLLITDPSKKVLVGELAVFYKSEDEAIIVLLEEEVDGKLFGQLWGSNKKISMNIDDMEDALHKIVQIIMP